MKEILRFNPCDEAVEFIKDFDSFEDAWNTCHRGDWMLWVAGKLKVEEKLMFKAKALCAKTVMHLMKDERSVSAVNKALEYSEGLISREELSSAHSSAHSAANYYYTAYYSAAYSAAHSAAAASYPAYPASSASFVAAASASASLVDAASSVSDAFDGFDVFAKSNNQKQTAKICREVLTDEVFRLIKL